eukprot:6924734-Pyramimonas_sp.AAC.1
MIVQPCWDVPINLRVTAIDAGISGAAAYAFAVDKFRPWASHMSRPTLSLILWRKAIRITVIKQAKGDLARRSGRLGTRRAGY